MLCCNCSKEIKTKPREAIKGKGEIEFYCSIKCKDTHEAQKKEYFKKYLENKIEQGYTIQLCECGNHLPFKNTIPDNCEICGRYYDKTERKTKSN